MSARSHFSQAKPKQKGGYPDIALVMAFLALRRGRMKNPNVGHRNKWPVIFKIGTDAHATPG